MQGVITALITPFLGRELDRQGLRQLIERQVKGGVASVLLLGTTGEAPALTMAEKETLLAIGSETLASRLPFLAGAGAPSTQETLTQLQMAVRYGASAALIVSPYYLRTTQRGLLHHFLTLAEHSPIPILLYNNPKRCGVNIEPETLRQLADHPNILGLKEANLEPGHLHEVMAWKRDIRLTRPHFRLWSGDDAASLSFMALGADGVISVLSNLLPQAFVEMIESASQGDFKRALDQYHALWPLIKASGYEPNPIPIKAMLSLAGLPAGEGRSPLVPLSSSFETRIGQLLENYPSLVTSP